MTEEASILDLVKRTAYFEQLIAMDRTPIPTNRGAWKDIVEKANAEIEQRGGLGSFSPQEVSAAQKAGRDMALAWNQTNTAEMSTGYIR